MSHHPILYLVGVIIDSQLLVRVVYCSWLFLSPDRDHAPGRPLESMWTRAGDSARSRIPATATVGFGFGFHLGLEHDST